jgi:DNA-binding CsgD family transcriptional regulator
MFDVLGEHLRVESQSRLTAALLDHSPKLLRGSAAGVAWFGDAFEMTDVQLVGVPAPLVNHYEKCGFEIDDVQKAALTLGIATHNLQLGDESFWLRHPMYREMGRPSGLLHYMAAPIAVDGRIRGVFGVARRTDGAPFTETDRCDAMAIAMFASSTLTRLSLLESEPWDTLRLLTSRERTIADCVARGLTNKEIGTLLLVSVNTVKAALKSIFAKLNVDSRSRLASLVACAPPGLLGRRRP